MPRRGVRGVRPRQWTTIDGMILIAATGIGLVGPPGELRDTGSAWGFRGQTYVQWAATLAQVAMLA